MALTAGNGSNGKQAVTTANEVMLDADAAHTGPCRQFWVHNDASSSDDYLVFVRGKHPSGKGFPLPPGYGMIFGSPVGEGGGDIDKVTGQMASGTGYIRWGVVQ